MAERPTIRSVTADRFDDMAALFEARGGPDYCWCLAWRAKSRDLTRARGAEGKALRKQAMRERVLRGDHIGLLAYLDGAPVGWCSCGPLSGYARLGGPKDIDPDRCWSISCFYVVRAHRGEGLSRALTEAAIAAARAAGASVFQVTGVAPDSPSYRFMGLVPFYESLGFTEIAMAGTRRHVMRLAL